MTREQFIEDKKKAIFNARLDIVNEIINCAHSVVASLPKRKSAFRRRNRKPKQSWQSRVGYSIYLSAVKVRLLQMQERIIMQQPIPKGLEITNQIAIVGDDGKKELILTPDGKKLEIKKYPSDGLYNQIPTHLYPST